MSQKNSKDHEKEEWLDVLGEDLSRSCLRTMKIVRNHISTQMNTEPMIAMSVSIRVLAIQIEKLRAEIDTKPREEIRSSASERFLYVTESKR